MSQSGMFFPTLPEDAAAQVLRPFYKRRGVLVAVALFIVVAAAVITDLPRHPSLAAQVASDTAAVKEMNSDVGPCAFAVGEALTIHHDQVQGMLTASDRAQTPALLQQDQVACSFTSQPINDLATIELPGSDAGKSMNNLVSALTLWTSSDADAAIIDVTQLFEHPGAARSMSDLVNREHLMVSDRRAAIAADQAASTTLHSALPAVSLPVFATSG